MKFMVLCLLHPAGTPAAGIEIAKGLARAGLEPVGSSRSAEGLAFGLDNAYVGEFRAPDAATLEASLSEHLGWLLTTSAGAGFQLVVHSLGPAPMERRRA